MTTAVARPGRRSVDPLADERVRARRGEVATVEDFLGKTGEQRSTGRLVAALASWLPAKETARDWMVSGIQMVNEAVREPPLMPGETRRCSKCNRVRLVECFAFRNRAKGIRRTDCNDCHADLATAHYLRDKDDYKRRRDDHRAWVSMVLDEAASKPCVRCGSVEQPRKLIRKFDGVLSKLNGRSFTRELGKETIQAELKACDAVCTACSGVVQRQDSGP